jgi:succinoglycan biosynthesis protein ExoO
MTETIALAPATPERRVTIITPSYNSRDCIKRAVDSALAQTFADFELVLVDDASSDGTAALVEQAYRGDDRIRVIRLDRNGGAAHARNAGLAVARGEWIALLDADDAWHPDRLARLLERSADADAVFDNLAGYDPETGAETPALFPEFPKDGLSIEALMSPEVPGSRYDFGYLKPIMRRAFLLSRGVCYDESLRRNQDLLLYTAMLLEGARTRTVNAPLYRYTVPARGRGPYINAQSNFVPRDDDLRRALEHLQDRFAGRLSEGAAHALERRIAFLRRIRPISEFYHARRRGDYRRMAALLVSQPAVCGEVISKLWQRLRMPGTWLRHSSSRHEEAHG